MVTGDMIFPVYEHTDSDTTSINEEFSGLYTKITTLYDKRLEKIHYLNGKDIDEADRDRDWEISYHLSP